MWGNAENLAVTIGKHVLPPAKWLIGLFNDGMKAAMDFAEEHKELIANIVYGGAVGAAGAALMAMGAGAIALKFAVGLLMGGVAVLGAVLSFVTGPAMLVVGAISTSSVAGK